MWPNHSVVRTVRVESWGWSRTYLGWGWSGETDSQDALHLFAKSESLQSRIAKCWWCRSSKIPSPPKRRLKSNLTKINYHLFQSYDLLLSRKTLYQFRWEARPCAQSILSRPIQLYMSQIPLIPYHSDLSILYQVREASKAVNFPNSKTIHWWKLWDLTC